MLRKKLENFQRSAMFATDILAARHDAEGNP